MFPAQGAEPGRAAARWESEPKAIEETVMNNIIYLVGLVVVVLVILSFFGLR